ncbi:MAG: prepilin-type N-terminal cleavage/methylation domain-containing protein [Candidatus Sumerlaeota bacterium]
MKKAFTLIELLIVVAIIAILAAIAVPNFLEAQTRAKVSRAKADQRSLATGLEAYAVDWSKYPFYNNHDDVGTLIGESITFVPESLTSPVAWLTSLPIDPFPGKRSGLPVKPHTYFYKHNIYQLYLGNTNDAGHIQQHYLTLTGSNRAVQWEMWSFGPDIDDDHGTVLYDPTNGTVSNGDMMRFGP